ncbi:hypothetical protein Tco_0608713 [Tanacetum coccineum]
MNLHLRLDSERTESDRQNPLLDKDQDAEVDTSTVTSVKVHSGSMSSLKILDDTFNFGDQFLHDNPTEDDQEKSKAREESDSTIPDPSHQTETSTSSIITPLPT